MCLGKNIRHLRKSSGMTQDELAERLELKYTSIGKYEREENVPPAHILVTLSQIFSVSVDDLLKVDLEARTQVQGELKKPSPELAARLAELEAQVRDNHDRLMAGNGAEAYQEQLQLLKKQLIRRHPEVARDLGLID